MRAVSWAPVEWTRNSSTLVAWPEKRAKLVPLPSQLAPPGYGRPSSMSTPSLFTRLRGCHLCRRWGWPIAPELFAYGIQFALHCDTDASGAPHGVLNLGFTSQ